MMAKRALSFSPSDEVQDNNEGEVQGNQEEKTDAVLTPKKVKTSDANATISAIVASVSPTKPKKSNFFDGELTDREAIVRVVGFDQQQRDALKQYKEKCLPVTLRNVQIQENKITKKMEVVLKTYSKMEQSSMKFESVNVAILSVVN